MSCSLGTLNVAASATVTIVVTVDPARRTAPEQYCHDHGHRGPDPTTANNSATASTTVQARADLSITKGDSPDPVTAGQNLTYTVKVTNSGPSTASAVTVTDTLPAGVTFVSATPPVGFVQRNEHRELQPGYACRRCQRDGDHHRHSGHRPGERR